MIKDEVCVLVRTLWGGAGGELWRERHPWEGEYRSEGRREGRERRESWDLKRPKEVKLEGRNYERERVREGTRAERAQLWEESVEDRRKGIGVVRARVCACVHQRRRGQRQAPGAPLLPRLLLSLPRQLCSQPRTVQSRWTARWAACLLTPPSASFKFNIVGASLFFQHRK